MVDEQIASRVLDVGRLEVRYGGVHALQGVSFSVPRGQVVALLGRNGAGKSTTLKAIMGIARACAGEVSFNGASLHGMAPHRIARTGIAYVPETRAIFSSLSVLENLTVAARAPLPDESHHGLAPWSLDRVFDLFPRLAERRATGGGFLSGGEQQMLTIARALMTNPSMLLLDEPTEGLAPVVVDQLERAIRALKASGLSVLLVEQNLAVALALADRAVVIGKGLVRWSGSTAEFADAGPVRERWLTV